MPIFYGDQPSAYWVWNWRDGYEPWTASGTAYWIASLNRSSSPIRIPGVSGSTLLDLNALVVVGESRPGSGMWVINHRATGPGIPVYVQPLVADWTAGAVQLGKEYVLSY